MSYVANTRIQTNGVDLNALLVGPAKGPLVVLLHGFPEFWFGWRRQIQQLSAAGMRVLVPDQRGYNLSSKPIGTAAYALDTLADDVIGLAEALGYDRFRVAGHDWGGALAWHLAGRDPERVERAAVLNGPHPATVWGHTLLSPSQALKGWYVGFFQVPAWPEAVLAAGGYAWLRGMLAGTARPGTFSEDELARYEAAWSQPGALSAMINWYRALPMTAPLSPQRISVPVRVIWGDQDPFMDAGLAQAGLALCDASGEAFHIENATHWVHHEEARRVNALLLEFLA
jgi:pimeloyl-ACP methyl ester carboxylesterase